ncbi:MAG: prepilin-type N-terminal cleavage/methylation domain-containing protein [Pseudomonadota bacterium]|nr:MAG: hypothetical protein DIU78_09090 [Pseudomonadota bacterium]
MTTLCTQTLLASSARAGRRGFTLVELLVALTGGLFVSIVVFTLARDASRFYQREGRMAGTTLAAISGFERLRADIARAGFLASPNVQSDPYVCSRPDSGAPALLRNLAAVRITKGGSPDNDALEDNSLDPDSIVLAGAYSSADEFPVRTVFRNADDTYTVYLQEDSGAMARLGYAAATDKAALLASVFTVGRAVRILDNEGRQHYGLIGNVVVGSSGNEPRIVLSSRVPLLFRRDSSNRFCGLKGLETGATINVVNFIRYDIRSLSGNANYAALYAARAGLPGESQRTELVRAELDPSDAEGDAVLTIDDVPLEELVAEYAVDLDFEIGAVTNGPTEEPVVTHLTASDTAFGSFTGSGTLPHRIRTVRVRLGVRSREADRDAPIGSVPGVAPGLYRFRIADSKPEYARVRTLSADVLLMNQAGVTW